MFYIIYSSYSPNTAATNRMLSFIRAYDELSIKGTVVFVSPNQGYDRIDKQYKNLSIRYLWKRFPLSQRRTLISRAYERIYRDIAYHRFIHSLKKGDNVLLYDPHKALKDLVKKKGIKVYHERTENPMVVPISEVKEQQLYLEACKKVNGLFVISTALKRFFINIGVDERKIKIVNMTVDQSRFTNLKKQSNKEKYIVYCGNGTNNKDGMDELIKAFAITHQTHPEVKLYIVGPMPDKQDEAGNLKLIDDLGIKDNVVFKGIQPANAIPQILKDATICALDRPDSVQAQNGFPTKLGEYLLSETPVVVTKVGDIPLFLKDKENAMLAEQRNPEDFSNKMNWLLDHPKEAASIGTNGADLARRSFNPIIEAEKIVNVIF